MAGDLSVSELFIGPKLLIASGFYGLVYRIRMGSERFSTRLGVAGWAGYPAGNKLRCFAGFGAREHALRVKKRSLSSRISLTRPFFGIELRVSGKRNFSRREFADATGLRSWGSRLGFAKGLDSQRDGRHARKETNLGRLGKDWSMLVLSRKKNESIVINNDIKIVVVEIRGDKVRLGVEAPREVPVHRREVYDAIQRSLESGDAPVES